MAARRRKTFLEAGADLWVAIYRLRDALLEPFAPVLQALERLLEKEH